MRRSGEVVLARQAGGRGRGRAGARRQAGGWMSLTMSQGSEGGAGGGIYARFNEGRPCRECVFVLVRCMPRAAQRPHPCSLAASFPVAGHLYLSATSYGPLAAGPHTPVSAQRRAVARCRACWLLHGPGHVQHMAARGVCTCGVLTVVALAGYRAPSALHTVAVCMYTPDVHCCLVSESLRSVCSSTVPITVKP